jgi:hypothetical protein
MSLQISLADLRSTLKESVIEGKMSDSGIYITILKPRDSVLDKSKMTLKELSKLPFQELIKRKNIYYITFDKDIVLDDVSMTMLSRISQSNNFAMNIQKDKHDKNKLILVVGNVCNLSFEENQSVGIIESPQGQQLLT